LAALLRYFHQPSPKHRLFNIVLPLTGLFFGQFSLQAERNSTTWLAAYSVLSKALGERLQGKHLKLNQ